jgi:hypothetical protein
MTLQLTSNSERHTQKKYLLFATRKTRLSPLAKPWRATARDKSINYSIQPGGLGQKIETLQTKDLGSMPVTNFLIYVFVEASRTIIVPTELWVSTSIYTERGYYSFVDRLMN